MHRIITAVDNNFERKSAMFYVQTFHTTCNKKCFMFHINSVIITQSDHIWKPLTHNNEICPLCKHKCFQCINIVHEIVNPRWEICCTVSESGFQQASFVNSIATTKVRNYFV